MEQAILDKIYQKWVPKIEAAFKKKGFTNVTESKIKELAEMANTRYIMEMNRSRSINEAYATLDGVNGRGDFSFGNNPQSGTSGFYGNSAKGSGEVMSSLFNVFMETVHHCIAFDIMPSIPQPKSSGTFYVIEPVYGGGKMDSAAKKPLMIMVKAIKNSTAAALTVGTDYTLKTGNSGENIAVVTFVGIDKIKGYFVFKIGTQYDNSGSAGTNWQAALAKDLFDSTVNNSGIYTSGSIYWSFDGNTVDLVPGFANFVGGFSGAGENDNNSWFLDRGNGKVFNKNMTRQTGEKTYYRPLGLRYWNKNYQAGTVHVDIEYTTEQIQDAKHDHGINIQDMGDKAMTNELTQHINDHALGMIFAMGWSNHYQMVQAGGPNLNILFGPSGNTGSSFAFLGKEDNLLTITGVPGALPASGAISENMSTLQRRLVTRILFASDVINHRSRRGRGDTVILNTTLGSALKDVRGYTAAPFQNNLNGGSAYYAGKFNDLDIYIDPLMGLDDYRVAVFRKGAKDDPGLKMMPFILAEKITTIAEGTMAPKTALKSRYSIVPAGSYPELNYLTFYVESNSGYQLV